MKVRGGHLDHERVVVKRILAEDMRRTCGGHAEDSRGHVE